MCLLNLVGWQGSQIIAYTKALVGTLNTASVNLPVVKAGPIIFTYDFQ